MLPFLATELENVTAPPHHFFELPSVNPFTTEVPMANQFNVAMQIERDVAEIIFGRFSASTVGNIARMDASTKPTLPVEGVALLRGDPATLKLFLVKLYEALDVPRP